MLDTWTNAHRVTMALACVMLTPLGCTSEDERPSTIMSGYLDAGHDPSDDKIELDTVPDLIVDAAAEDSAESEQAIDSAPDVGGEDAAQEPDCRLVGMACGPGCCDGLTCSAGFCEPVEAGADAIEEPCACSMLTYHWTVTKTLSMADAQLWYECPPYAQHDPDHFDTCVCAATNAKMYGAGDMQHCIPDDITVTQSCTLTFQCTGLWCEATQKPCE